MIIFRTLLLFTGLVLASVAKAQNEKADIFLLGSDHFAQLYKRDNSNTDVLTPKHQRELSAFIQLVMRYAPDRIMIEALPEEQPRIDSLYTLYIQDKLDLNGLEDGRSEIYQLAFRIAKMRQLPKLYCVNAPGGTSQSILDNGDHIELYKEEGTALRSLVTKQYNALQKDSLSLKDFLLFINKPTTIAQVHHLRYVTPARITNGKFRNPDSMVDTAFVNPRYIGAELTAIFKNRDYKIYSNIVTAQMASRAKRILLIIGAAHIGSLQSIFRDDPEYKLVKAAKYLK